MENKLLSIVIPVYNTSKYLESCLTSAMNQTYRNIEIICVDDSSSDNSLELLEKLSNWDRRIKVFHHSKNEGFIEARRTGVKAVNGVYTMFLDSDDTIENDLCGTLMERLQKEDKDILHFPARQILVETDKIEMCDPPEICLNGNEILNELFVSGKVSTSLVLKIYSTALCKKAYQEIPAFYCCAGADILTSFFIGYFAESYEGVRIRPRYNYYLGKGLSTVKHVSLEKFEKYCKMSCFYTIINDFLERKHADEASYRCLEYMTRRLVRDCCNYFSMVPDGDKDEAARIFWSQWSDIPYFAESIMYAFHEQKMTIRELKNSESYRLGNTFVRPLKKINEFLQGN